jgi:hypothetical protein
LGWGVFLTQTLSPTPLRHINPGPQPGQSKTESLRLSPKTSQNEYRLPPLQESRSDVIPYHSPYRNRRRLPLGPLPHCGSPDIQPCALTPRAAPGTNPVPGYPRCSSLWPSIDPVARVHLPWPGSTSRSHLAAILFNLVSVSSFCSHRIDSQLRLDHRHSIRVRGLFNLYPLYCLPGDEHPYQL